MSGLKVTPMVVELNDLQPKLVANAIADLIRVSPHGLEPLPDGYERMPGAETHISDDRTVLVSRQYYIHTNRFRFQVRICPKLPPAENKI